jgi:Domain of unknown function (DUF3943)
MPTRLIDNSPPSRTGLVAALVVAGFLAAAGSGWAQASGAAAGLPSDSSRVALGETGTSPDGVETYVVKRRPVLAAAEILGTNTAIWIYDRYIRSGGGEGFKIGFQSWKQNILNGFEWDDNNFDTNQFAHPYHGSLYFNAARSNGYNFWESIPFTWAGSFTWEYFYETHHPALNDWVNTSMGGTTLGEALDRLATMVTDNTATGSGRTWKELGGMLIDPMRGFTRLVTGDFTRVYPNPKDRFPKAHTTTYVVGLRTVGDEELWNTDTTRVYMALAASYGDPFLGEYKRPFDSMDFAMQLNFDDASTLGVVSAKGILFATPLSESKTSQSLIGAYQHFDYFNNNAFVFGEQSVSGSFLYRSRATKSFEMRTALHMNVVIMGAAKSDYANVSGRDYDFGPGLGYKFNGVFYRNGYPFLSLGTYGFWIYSLNGTVGSHLISGTNARLDLPLTDGMSFGVDYFLYLSDNRYQDFPDVTHRVPELRTSIAWHL